MTIQYTTDERQIGWAEWQNQTTIHPLALASLAVACVLTLLLPRKYALIPSMAIVCLVPSAQRIVVLGLDFTMLRILAGTGLLRVLVRSEFHRGRWRTPDTVILAWAATSLGAYTLLRGESSAFILRLGLTTEAIGLYFMVRGLITTWTDLRMFQAAVVVLSVIVAIAFLNEKVTGRNIFSIFAGVPAVTMVREGRLRCQGAFPHPILAGCFWAVQAAYVASLWWSRLAVGRLAAVTGFLCAGIIIVTCASSTPASALIAGTGAGMWFVFRHHSKLLRYSVASALVVLHVVMKAPVWHLIARIDLAGGSTGYHRYLLIDAAIRNFPEWALLGTVNTVHWGGVELSDITNQYVYEGVTGGVLQLCLFLALISMCFGRVGLIWRHAGRDREKLALGWGLGVGLFVHCISFLGVSYFGQLSFAWYFSLAAIVSIAEPFDSRGKAAPAWKPRGGKQTTLTPNVVGQ